MMGSELQAAAGAGANCRRHLLPGMTACRVWLSKEGCPNLSSSMGTNATFVQDADVAPEMPAQLEAQPRSKRSRHE